MTAWRHITKGELEALYHGQRLTARRIGILFGVHNANVLRKMQRLGIERRDYREKLHPGSRGDHPHDRRSRLLSERFAQLTPNLAYLLGLLVTDGNIYRDGNGGYRVALYSRDKELVEFAQQEMGAGRISCRRDRELYEWRCFSKGLVDRLSTFGIVPKKSMLAQYPTNIPEPYQRYFIRGIFDGDGSVHDYCRKGRAMVAFTSGSECFLSSLSAALHRFAGTSPKKVYTVGATTAGNPAYRLSFLAAADTARIFRYLYDGVGMKLGRKFERYARLVGDPA